MKKTFALVLALIMVFSLAACGGGGNSSTGGGNNSTEGNTSGGETATTQPEETLGETQTAGNITVLVPDGWRLKPGDAGGIENDDALFLLSTEGDTPYLWVKIVDEANRDSSLGSNSNADIDPFTVEGVEWTGKDNMITATVDGTIWMVMNYGFEGYTDETVRAVLGSLKAK